MKGKVIQLNFNDVEYQQLLSESIKAGIPFNIYIKSKIFPLSIVDKTFGELVFSATQKSVGDKFSIKDLASGLNTIKDKSDILRIAKAFANYVTNNKCGIQKTIYKDANGSQVYEKIY